MSDNTQDHLREIATHVQEGRAVLFLGAGASHAAGGPLGGKLTELIKSRFPKIDQSLSRLIDVCQDVVDTPPYNRNDLEEFIARKLDLLQPTTEHKTMTKYDWAAIFTSNFDDLVEVSYRTAPERLKQCHPVYSDRFEVNQADRSRVYLFKLMGSVTAVAGDTGLMVLSRTDYHRALVRRRAYFEHMADFVKAGTMIFVGYSFGDELVLDIMGDITERYGLDRLPWSYALFSGLQLDEKARHMFSTRKIIPLECSFQQFFQYLDKSCTEPVTTTRPRNQHLSMFGYDLEIDEREARQHAEYFEILSEESIREDPGSRDDFFKGINKSWGAFREGWDFKRSLYSSADYDAVAGQEKPMKFLRDRVFDELEEPDANKNRVLLVKGMAGVGKTTMLRRLAFDVYESGRAPVIIVRAGRTTFDYRLLASFIENLNYQFNQKIGPGEHRQPLKPLIIVDNAASMIRHVNRIKDYLSARGRAALIVVAERQGEWDLSWKAFPFTIRDDNVYALDERLNDRERGMIVEHFYNLGYIRSRETGWDDIVRKDFENSFFATIYTLVDPSRKPLNQIIQEQYTQLTDQTQKAFRNICCFHQFNLPINLELLVRSLRCSYADFRSDVLAKDAAKVIFEDGDESGGLLYRAHHRIIASKTVEFFFGDPQAQMEIFLEILKEAVLTNRTERQICEKLLVWQIGPNARPQVLSYDQQREIFRVACQKYPIRSLVHHWGVLETDAHNYLEAKGLLERALELPREDIEAYRGESDQTILTSLGNLYSRLGVAAMESGGDEEARGYFEKAEACFRDAKHGEFPNAHAYHAHANMWYQRGNDAASETEALHCYARALEILTMARDNLNADDLQAVHELETLVWQQIGDETRVEQCLEALRDGYGTPRGYYLCSQLLRRKALGEGEGRREELLKAALARIEEGLEHFPSDEHCLGLRARMWKELVPDELKKYHAYLRKWKAAATIPNARLLYELARAAFILGYYEDSKRFFEELETGVGLGHRLRNRPQHPMVDAAGNVAEFEGVVANIASSYEGGIRCDSLRNLRYAIVFRPITCGFTPSRGDMVKFNIAFNFRNAIAIKVRRA